MQTAALPGIAASAGGAALGLAAFVHDSIDPIVLASTASASFKLFLICAVVGWLLESKKIPSNTASVLSQVSFQLLIPCMLFSRVASTLANQPDGSLILGMALAALGQIAIGALLGAVFSPLVDGNYSRKFTLWGWHPLDADRPATAIATATAAAAGLPLATAALLPRPAPAPAGLRELIATACTFGNTFTLPVVFFLGLLPPLLADRAIAYVGIFLLAWSPCLWSMGLTFIEAGFNKQEAHVESEEQQLRRQLLAEGSVDIENCTQQQSPSAFGTIRKAITSLRGAVLRVLRRTLNPPILAILAGVLVGTTPAGKHLFAAIGHSGGAAAAAGGQLPLELSLTWAALRNAYEVVEMLAAGTLAMQTLVLASSLLQRPEGAPSTAPLAQEDGAQAPRAGLLKTIARALLPSSPTEARALAVLSAVRFVLLPVCCVGVFKWVASLGLLGPLALDPIFLFVIAVQTVMPSAQNLIIVLQLSDVTRPAAPAFAKMLLKLYAYAILPVTFWVTAFASRLAIPLA